MFETTTAGTSSALTAAAKTPEGLAGDRFADAILQATSLGLDSLAGSLLDLMLHALIDIRALDVFVTLTGASE